MTDTPNAATEQGSQAKVLAALVTLGDATAAAVAEQAGLAYSTTTPKLRALQQAGHAETFRTDGRTFWRATEAGRAAAEADVTDSGNEPDHGAADTGAADTGDEPVAPVQSDNDDVSAHSDGPNAPTARHARMPNPLPAQSDPDDPAEAGNAAGQSAPTQPAEDGGFELTTTDTGSPADLTPAVDGVAEPAREGPGPDEPSGDPEPDSGQPEQPPGADLPAGDAAAPTANGSCAGGSASKQRRPSGTLRGAILDVLEARPDHGFKVGELCKLIDKANEGTPAAKASPGAVYNAAVKLAGASAVVQTVDKPATFQIAAAG